MIVTSVNTKFGSITFCDEASRIANLGKVLGTLRYERFATKVIDELQFTDFVDVGAAFGFFSHYVKGTKPDVLVTAIEPEPLRYACLSYTTGEFSRLPCIIGENLDINLRSPGAMLVADSVGTPHFVGQRPLESFDAPNETTLYKLDIEGAEFPVIEACPPSFLQDTSNLFLIEIHELKHGKHTPKEKLLEHFSTRSVFHLHSGKSGINHTYLIT